MKTVCIFNGDMSRGGGTEKITQVLANGLVKTEKYKIIVLNLSNQGSTSYYPLENKVLFRTLNETSILKKIKELARFLKKERIDVIINVDIMLGIYTIPATMLYPKTKFVSWEMFNLRNNIGSKHTNTIRKICLRRSAYYINQTIGDMQAFMNEMPVKCPIDYIYNPCDIDMNYQGYDTNSKTIVTAGHFFYTKGYDLAVEVANIVLKKHPDWKWKFFGDGVELNKCKEKASEYGLTNLEFCGRTNNIIDEFKKAAMYIMTSRTEGFGLVLTEAKSCNLPTLAFDIDFGPREIIENEVSGYLVKDFNINVMAERICELIEKPDLRKQFSMKAKDNCDKFSLDQFVMKWDKILSSI
ncbi:MAG: glycosyltransferase family 4 protein [Ruminococcus sp.]|nr:glycosyltransferase family 4 protein [Ruminococcus sp.]